MKTCGFETKKQVARLCASGLETAGLRLGRAGAGHGGPSGKPRRSPVRATANGPSERAGPRRGRAAPRHPGGSRLAAPAAVRSGACARRARPPPPGKERATLPSAHASALAAASPPSPLCWPPAPSSFSHSAPLSGLGRGTATAQRDTACSQKRALRHPGRSHSGRAPAAPARGRLPLCASPVCSPPALGNKYTRK